MQCPKCGSTQLLAVVNADVFTPVEGPDREHLTTTGPGAVTYLDEPRALRCAGCGWEEAGEIGFSHIRHGLRPDFAIEEGEAHLIHTERERYQEGEQWLDGWRSVCSVCGPLGEVVAIRDDVDRVETAHRAEHPLPLTALERIRLLLSATGISEASRLEEIAAAVDQAPETPVMTIFFGPEAIRQHFDGRGGEIEAWVRAQDDLTLSAVGAAAREAFGASEFVWETFGEVLGDAVAEVMAAAGPGRRQRR
jgi:hypothetical protein